MRRFSWNLCLKLRCYKGIAHIPATHNHTPTLHTHTRSLCPSLPLSLTLPFSLSLSRSLPLSLARSRSRARARSFALSTASPFVSNAPGREPALLDHTIERVHHNLRGLQDVLQLNAQQTRKLVRNHPTILRASPTMIRQRHIQLNELLQVERGTQGEDMCHAAASLISTCVLMAGLRLVESG